jgi:O-antigen/teichoic acid export membrane protein
MIAFSKMGIQNSIVRYYPEYNTGDKNKQSEFFSTYFFSVLAIGVALFIIFVAFIPILTKKILSIDDPMPFYVAAFFLPLHGVFSAFGNFFRARQESVKFNLVTISEVYLPLFAGLLFMIFFGAKLVYFFIGGVIVKVIYLSYFGNNLNKDFGFRTSVISRNLVKNAFLYGFPLMLLELSSNMLAYGDRFIIKYYLESKDVAIYSVGYNLATYMANIFVVPINNALQVEYIEIWTKQGLKKTEEYLSRTCKVIMYFGTIFCVMMILNFMYVVLFFATSKYTESIKIAPFVITSVMIYSLYPVFGAGIYVSNKTKSLFYGVLFALFINISMNIILVPRMGIMGAAISTFAANILAALCIYLYARRSIKIRIGIIHVLLCFITGSLVYYLCQKIEFNNIVANVLSKSISSFCVYSAVLMYFDAEYKYYCKQVAGKVWSLF